jgi:hypothetical protein
LSGAREDAFSRVRRDNLEHRRALIADLLVDRVINDADVVVAAAASACIRPSTSAMSANGIFST